MNKRLRLNAALVVALSSFAVPPCTGADEGGELLVPDLLNVDEHHRRSSRLVLRAAESLNRFLFDTLADEESKESPLLRQFYGDRVSAYDVEGAHLRLTPRSTWVSGRGFKQSVDFSARLRLGDVSDRLRFYADSHDMEHDTVSGIFSESYRRKLDRERSDGASAGLMYMLSDRVHRRISVSSGLRFRPNPIPRLRVNARFRTDMGKWEAAFTQGVFWDGRDGFGERSKLDFSRPIGVSHVFSSHSTAVWSEISEGVDWGHTFAWQTALAADKMFSVRAGARGPTHPSAVTDQYLFRVAYRQPAVREWLLWQVEAGWDFMRDEQYEARPLIGLRVDVLIGG